MSRTSVASSQRRMTRRCCATGSSRSPRWRPPSAGSTAPCSRSSPRSSSAPPPSRSPTCQCSAPSRATAPPGTPASCVETTSLRPQSRQRRGSGWGAGRASRRTSSRSTATAATTRSSPAATAREGWGATRLQPAVSSIVCSFLAPSLSRNSHASTSLWRIAPSCTYWYEVCSRVFEVTAPLDKDKHFSRPPRGVCGEAG
mmetsp:Transcript_17177/g.50501  ORF Transcript_17177/g.50501 Transcript_17177/m.50501 type:complete len:200 (-) Transcript_17177:1155-1754(-)